MQFQRHTGLFGSSAHIAIGSGGGTRATPLVPVKRNISTATVCSPNNGNMIDLSYLAAVGGNNLKRNARALARVTVSAFLRKV